VVGHTWEDVFREIEKEGQEGKENDGEKNKEARKLAMGSKKKSKGAGRRLFIINLRSIRGACARSSSRQNR
jgi:hypothetical protein